MYIAVECVWTELKTPPEVSHHATEDLNANIPLRKVHDCIIVVTNSSVVGQSLREIYGGMKILITRYFLRLDYLADFFFFFKLRIHTVRILTTNIDTLRTSFQQYR